MSIFFPEASGSSNLGSNRNDIYMPGPPVGNDQALNDWLKKDLINRQNSDRNYKQMAVSIICNMDDLVVRIYKFELNARVISIGYHIGAR